MNQNMSRDYRWDDLRVVLALLRGGSLKAAAASLDIHVSTVGRRLDALEEAIGLQLFDRTPDGTRPTVHVEKLLPHAEMMEQASMAIANVIDGFESTPKGRVRITAPPGLADLQLAEALAALSSRYPELELELDSRIGYSDLTRREADIALRVRRPTHGDLITTKLGSYRYGIGAAPEVVHQHRRLARLNDVRWVTYDDSLRHIPEAQWVDSHLQPPDIALRSNSITAQLQAVRHGVGVILVPHPFLLLEGIEELPLRRSLKSKLGPFPQAQLWLIGHRALRSVPRIAVVWDFLIDTFRTA